MFVAMNFHNN